MTIELKYLAWAIVLGLVHGLSTGPLTIIQHGLAYSLSSRDEKKPLSGMAARVERAFSNFIQTFPLFAAAVLVAHAAGRHSGLTIVGRRTLLLGAGRLCALLRVRRGRRSHPGVCRVVHRYRAGPAWAARNAAPI